MDTAMRKKTWIEQLQENQPRVQYLVVNPDFLDDSNPYMQLFGGMPNKEQEIKRIADALKQTFRALSMTDAEQREFLAEVSAKAIHAHTSLIPVEHVPLWMDRADRKETPPDFIKRVYAQWLGNGMTQAHLLHIDKQLYFAFHKWLRSNPMPADLDLPTRKQVNDRLLESVGDVTAPNRTIRAADLDPQTRIQQRAYDARRYRAKLG